MPGQHNEEMHSFAALQNRLIVGGELVARTGVRIGAGRSNDVSGSNLPVLRDARSRPFIPGASLKGALRARLEALIRAVAPEQALDLPELEAWQRAQIEPLKQDDDLRNDDRALTKAIWNHSTMIDQTFGAPWFAGRLFVKDALVVETLWFGQYEVRNGVALNRDTETAEERLLYEYEVVPAGTRFDFELVLENAEPWQWGMMLLALKPWERGEAAIGGFRTRGLGHIELTTTTRRFSEINGVDDVIDLLQNSAQSAGREVSADNEKTWVEAFRQHLTSCARKEQ
jgi:CRISPR-associated RAMP protein (TIGR02581 family)